MVFSVFFLCIFVGEYKTKQIHNLLTTRFSFPGAWQGHCQVLLNFQPIIVLAMKEPILGTMTAYSACQYSALYCTVLYCTDCSGVQCNVVQCSALHCK